MDKTDKKEYDTVIRSINFMADHIKKFSENFDHSIAKFIDEIIDAKTRRIFLMGGGRSGYEARAFGMRLTHLGFDVRIIGDATTPPVRSKDLVIAISRSGKTLANLGIVAKKIKAKLVAITSNENSDLGKISDVVVIIPSPDKINNNFAPLGTMFEATTHVFLDGIVAELMKRMNKKEEEMEMMHMFSGYVGIL